MVGKLKQKEPIQFFSDSVRLSLKNRAALKRFMNRLINDEGRTLNSLSYIFCNDEILLEINRKYLGRDFYTDVITFDLSNDPDEILADIYISLDRVKENSKNLKIPLAAELHRVMFHGLLHLCGYDDKTASQLKRMRTKEDFYLNLYFTRFT